MIGRSAACSGSHELEDLVDLVPFFSIIPESESCNLLGEDEVEFFEIVGANLPDSNSMITLPNITKTATENRTIITKPMTTRLIASTFRFSRNAISSPEPTSLTMAKKIEKMFSRRLRNGRKKHDNSMDKPSIVIIPAICAIPLPLANATNMALSVSASMFGTKK